VLGPSDVFGDLVALDPEATPQKALALGPTRLARVPADYLVSWLTADPARARHVLRWLAGRVLLGHEAMIDQQAIDIPRRVAQAVLDMAQRFGEPDREGVLVQHELTQAQLADLIGASREAVNRALSRLTRRGWLEIEKGSVMVHDLSAMIRYVDAARTTPYRYSHAQCRTADGWCAG
jgi:CRP/FNR family transcriptional regulator